ncbi:phosphoribosyl-ATP diphosphatase [Thiomicrorhabdus chilensis]|uniref:phosphoribosyl-ATP diphosphatase n=1 Tax=Thiomicrorhabdus chilensis TaxID=63656 RepID=UPI0004123955|nr:phosphoribosyl-ATP diphosphatase [Thiomicrorhabdus chilensis]
MNDILSQLDQVLESRKQDDPSQSYVASLYDKGLEKILKKIAEESAEIVMAAKDIEHNGDKEHLIYEVADLWFHTLVLLASQNLSSQDVTAELQRRFGLSGHEEKANRSL